MHILNLQSLKVNLFGTSMTLRMNYFFVVKGKLLIRLKDQDIHLSEGEFVIIPKGVEHLPIAEEEVHVMLVEPKTTLNVGDAESELKVEELDRI